MPDINITVTRGGAIKTIYDDRLQGIYQQGPTTTRRASHVEPGDAAQGQDPGQWYADMGPSGGPVLGPFTSRHEALAAEITWLLRETFGVKS